MEVVVVGVVVATVTEVETATVMLRVGEIVAAELDGFELAAVVVVLVLVVIVVVVVVEGEDEAEVEAGVATAEWSW